MSFSVIMSRSAVSDVTSSTSCDSRRLLLRVSLVTGMTRPGPSDHPQTKSLHTQSVYTQYTAISTTVDNNTASADRRVILLIFFILFIYFNHIYFVSFILIKKDKINMIKIYEQYEKNVT